ncbi:MAG: putative manganese-dependent inorganic diphosphatase [Bacilli bacterium]
MIYIFGHRKPDTDSICAALSLSYLKNQLGFKTEPMALGHINNETKFVLDTFNLKAPKYLNDVKLQIKDINYHKNCFLNELVSINEGYNYMKKYGLTGLPIVDKNNILTGLVTLKELAKELIEGNFTLLNTSYDNILKTLKGEAILKYDEEIIGNVLAASFRSTTFMETVKLNNKDILIVGDRHSILEYAVKSKVKLIVVVGDGLIKEEHLQLAKDNKVNIIKTAYDTYHTTKLINLSNYIKTVSFSETPISFEQNEYYSHFMDVANKLKHTNYPIIDKDNHCLGLLPMTLANNKNPKEVILVDHNEKEQSVDGLDEATILEVVDHHKLGTLATTLPINFRNMAVGSSNTIIYNIYKESKISIPTNIAGAMLSGIISDTLMLKSPTTTLLDKEAVMNLEKIAGVDYLKYGLAMFKFGSSLIGKSKEEIIYEDFKKFNYNDENIGIGQVFTTDIDYIMNEKEEYISILNNISLHNNYEIVALFITDVIKNGSYILFNDKALSVLMDSFDLNDLKQGHYFDGIVSRKKQIIPVILENL